MALLPLFLVALSGVATLATSVQPKDDKVDYRLPSIYDISEYKLGLYVPEASFTDKGNSYNGTVQILLAFTEETNSISLHADPDYITVTKIKFNNIVLEEADYSIDNVTDILKINLINPVKVKTNYYLIIEFGGRLSTTDMYGFYKSSYVDKNDTKYLATTQFEPTHARRAFPCFDEPSFKATFTLSITYPTSLKVLTNTPVVTKSTTPEEDSGLKTDVFEPTPKMSTYLLAFIISEFTCTPGDKIDTAAYQVCSRNDTLADREFAVGAGPLLVAKLNEFTGYNYSVNMKKLDQVAIPDFSAGAMENWGVITYREIALLWNKDESSNRYKQKVATTVAHELTHQWFGDLVTCNWWSEIFLNEGFATYFQYFIAHEVYPDWELDKQFVVETLQAVLDTDELENSQAIQSECSTPTEISAKFGDISYDKGASVLRMVASFLNRTNFIAGLRTYLAENEFKSTKPEQLWTALGEHVDNNVSNLPTNLTTIMGTWITKSGYPLLTVSLNGSNVTVSQEKFSLNDNASDTKWYVPISYTTSVDSDKFASTTPNVWLTPDNDLVINLPKNATWIILNNQETGYYRVNYDDALWGSIKGALQSDDFGGIGELNRAQIVDDVFALAKIKKITYGNAFETVRFLKDDTSYYSWYAAFQAYDFLLRRVGENSKLGKSIGDYLMDLMDNLYKSVPTTKLNDTQQVYTLKQVLAQTWACRLGHDSCVDDLKKLFSEYKKSQTRPDKNLRSAIYCTGLKYSDDAKTDWDFLWTKYTESDLATERLTILSALGCTNNPEILKNYLYKTISNDSEIRPQDTTTVFSSVYSGNPEGVAVAYDFLTGNYKTIAAKYQSMNALSSAIKGIAERFTTQEEVDKLAEFTSVDDIPEEFKHAASEALETARSNLKWKVTFEQELAALFKKNGAFRIGSSALVVLLAIAIRMFVS